MSVLGIVGEPYEWSFITKSSAPSLPGHPGTLQPGGSGGNPEVEVLGDRATRFGGRLVWTEVEGFGARQWLRGKTYPRKSLTSGESKRPL